MCWNEWKKGLRTGLFFIMGRFELIFPWNFSYSLPVMSDLDGLGYQIGIH